VLGVVPYLHCHGIEQEDAVFLEENGLGTSRFGLIHIAVIKLPRISNFTDIDPLYRLPGVRVRYVRTGERIGDADAVIIPGTKNTIRDLIYLRENGYEREIAFMASRGKWVVGICGGYQMLGREFFDPLGTEAGIGSLKGLGLLDASTVFRAEKVTRQVRGKVICREGFWADLLGKGIFGYEIHTGDTELGSGCRCCSTPCGRRSRCGQG